MIKSFIVRLRQGYRTMGYPDAPPPELSDRFRGHLQIDSTKCVRLCTSCVKACPTNALVYETGEAGIVDYGKCLFCTECTNVCPTGAVSFNNDYRLAVRTREDLIVKGKEDYRFAKELGKELKKLLGRSLKLRQVSAGGCNACEVDINVLGTIGWDLGRFGIQIVASPRHADGLIITGCLTENMRIALEKTYAAVAAPKIIIAVGACAISGGPFMNNSEQHSGVTNALKVDLFIPGCPPNPLTILDGLLRLIGKIKEKEK